MSTLKIAYIGSFEKAFSKLQRKAERLGLNVPTYEVVGTSQEKQDVFEALERSNPVKVGERMLEVSEIRLSGLDPVRLNGWSIRARVEPTDHGNLVFSGPGVDVPERFREHSTECEHCNLKRERSTLFLLQHDDGTWKQVGSTCLADFVGANSAEAVAAAFQFYGEAMIELERYVDAEQCGRAIQRGYGLNRIVAASIAAQEKWGWRSRAQERESGGTATATRVEDYLMGRNKSLEEPTQDHYEAATEAIKYLAELPDDQVAGSDFLHNLRVISQAGYCGESSFGIAVALPRTYRSLLGGEARKKRQQELRESSKHVGKVGERLTFSGTIMKVVCFDTEFGRSVMTIVEGDDGNLYKAKDIGSEGDHVTFKATVKKHSEHDGVKQTEVIRAKVLAVKEKAETHEEDPF